MELIIGSHVSFTKDTQLLGSLEETLGYNANAFMFYTGAPQNTNRCNIDSKITEEALDLIKKNNIDINNIVIHAPYIINLANGDNHDFGVRFLKEEIKRASLLGVKKIVLHPGSHVGIGYEEGIKNIIRSLNEALDNDYDVTVLIETMAGKGSECGITIEQIKTIIDNVNGKIGVCLDTCHLNDAGYDISSFDKYLNDFDNLIGINKIGCVHINDSKNVINAHKDRHENIGFGSIGFDNLLHVIYHESLKNVPKILETPYVGIDPKYPPYKFEIEMIRRKEFNPHLIEDIIEYYK